MISSSSLSNLGDFFHLGIPGVIISMKYFKIAINHRISFKMNKDLKTISFLISNFEMSFPEITIAHAAS